MPTRQSVAACFALAFLISAPAFAQDQAPRRITVEYQNAPLNRVAEAFATFSGRSIALAPDVGDPAVTSLVEDVDWESGLDQILATQSLVARPDSAGGLRIERERRISVHYQNARLSRVLLDIATFADRPIVSSPSMVDPEVTVSIHDVDLQRALDQILAEVGLEARADRAGVIRVTARRSR